MERYGTPGKIGALDEKTIPFLCWWTVGWIAQGARSHFNCIPRKSEKTLRTLPPEALPAHVPRFPRVLPSGGRQIFCPMSSSLESPLVFRAFLVILFCIGRIRNLKRSTVSPRQGLSRRGSQRSVCKQWAKTQGEHPPRGSSDGVLFVRVLCAPLGQPSCSLPHQGEGKWVCGEERILRRE